MKLAIVVQRYGTDISGGAELHARYLAKRLSSSADVRVLTTCARDHVTWKNEYAPGLDHVQGIPVERFRVTKERSLVELGVRSRRVFIRSHSVQEELEWLACEGPLSPDLVARLRRARGEFDFVVLFCARYYHAYHGARSLHDRAILVPTAERDPALGLAIFQPIFRGVRAIMYNSFEERALIQAVSNNDHVPGTVVGIGSEIPPTVSPGRAKAKFGLSRPFLLYVGRIDANKGCQELFDFFAEYSRTVSRDLELILVGTARLPIPAHPRIRHLGFLDDDDKFDVLAAADVLIMPSYYESLSMVMLEAWALGRPVLANAKCDVLLGQCLRSNAGLFYNNLEEFVATLDRLLDDPTLAAALGHNGREYFSRHYSWQVVERKYRDMFNRLESDPMTRPLDPLPGVFARRRASIPAAVDVVARLPSGPVTAFDQPAEIRE